jgi:hypothetical protein
LSSILSFFGGIIAVIVNKDDDLFLKGGVLSMESVEKSDNYKSQYTSTKSQANNNEQITNLKQTQSPTAKKKYDL